MRYPFTHEHNSERERLAAIESMIDPHHTPLQNLIDFGQGKSGIDLRLVWEQARLLSIFVVKSGRTERWSQLIWRPDFSK